MTLFNNFIHLFIESAPWLMLGLFVAGFMKAFVPQEWLAKHLGKPGFDSTVKAALLGAPLPLCSCGVIPAAMGLRRNGASKAATTSFLISTPETGIDSISISYALLGPFMAIIRPVAAITSAITAGILVGQDEELTNTDRQKTEDDTCCSNKKPVLEKNCCSSKSDTDKQTESNEHMHCINHNADKPVSHPSTLLQKIIAGLSFTFFNLVKDISLWLLIGLGFAAIIKTYVPTEFLAQWGDGFVAFIVMALIGVPMYICATASTPIAAGLLFSGISPGAVLVFMLVGPATNIATVGLVKKELGKRALIAYLSSVIGIGFLFGFLTNYLAKLGIINITEQTQHIHNSTTPIAYITSIILAALILNALARKYLSK